MPKKILVGILDWGLGHATRCVPLVSYLLQTQCQIFIAATGYQKKILEEAFPEVRFLDPPPYRIQYPPGGKNLLLSIVKQLPRLKKLIQEEHEWVSKVVLEHQIDLVISDNRYGFHAPGLPSAFITHQLSPRSGWGPLVDLAAQKLHYRYINAFDECWVPDLAADGGLAGALSHPPTLPPNVSYIGPLSRFTLGESTLGESGVLVVMSGPEPARTEFESIVRPQLKTSGIPYRLVRALPGDEDGLEPFEINHAGVAEMGKWMAEADVVICRSGYTSVMDLLSLRKKAVLVPTPGQTEQEYLAEHLQKKKLFPYLTQERFDLKHAVSIANAFEYRFPEMNFDAYKRTLDRFISK